jgi:hypothetical protein
VYVDSIRADPNLQQKLGQSSSAEEYEIDVEQTKFIFRGWVASDQYIKPTPGGR